jgi:hypothetical protein
MRHKNNKNAAKRSRKYNQKMMVTVHRDLRAQFPADSFALDLLDMTMRPPRISASLFSEMSESLKGFSESLQLEMVDDYIDCFLGIARHFTGISGVDRTLSNIYNKILKEKIHV